MIRFPFVFVLLLPWTIVMILGLRVQSRALAWIRKHSARERGMELSSLQRSSLLLHIGLIYLIGVLGIVAASGPVIRGETSAMSSGTTIILLVDGSLSMSAPDAPSPSDPGGKAASRLQVAREYCVKLLGALPETRFGLISFSGQAVIHMPPTRDHHALKTVIGGLRTHVYDQSSGSRFSSGFMAVAHLMREEKSALQIVLLSDGEISVRDDFGDGLAILARREIPVDCIGLGGENPVAMVAYDLDDLRAGVEKPGVALEFSTKRDLKNLKKIAGATGGMVMRGEDFGEFPLLLRTLQSKEAEHVEPGRGGRMELAHLVMLAALILLAVEGRVMAGRGRKAPRLSPWKQAGLIVLLLVSVSACRVPAFRAHRLNERGLALAEAGEDTDAVGFFEVSAGWGFREQIPIYNLARSLLRERDYAGAHEEYQRALRINPGMPEALFNDGWALFEWGRTEFDPKSCRFERVRERWEAARIRFQQAERKGLVYSQLKSDAGENLRFVIAALEQLEKLEEDCSGGGGTQGASGDGGNSQVENRNEEQNAGGGAGGSGEQDNTPRGSGLSAEKEGLSEEENSQLEEALSRIREESESSGDYRQSGKTQIKGGGGKGKGSGRKIWW